MYMSLSEKKTCAWLGGSPSFFLLSLSTVKQIKSIYAHKFQQLGQTLIKMEQYGQYVYM